VLRALRWLAERMSWQRAQRSGARLGRIMRWCARHRVRQATHNLNLAFGDELPARQRTAIMLRAFESVGQLGLEMLKLPRMTPDSLAEIAPIDGIEHLRAAREAGHGTILVSAHLGNWEIMGVRLIHEGYPVVGLSRSSSDQRIARAVTGVRQELDADTIPVAGGIRPCLRLLNENGILLIMPDRCARGQGLNVHFFGHRANIWHTPVLLSRRSHAALIPCHALRQPDGRFVVRLDPPLQLDATGDNERDLQVNTQRLFDHLEQLVRLYPEQYLWQYDLWSTVVRPTSSRSAPSNCAPAD